MMYLPIKDCIWNALQVSTRVYSYWVA